MHEPINKGASRGGYKFPTNRERTGEDHKAGFTIHKPRGDIRGGEQIKQTNRASRNTEISRTEGRN